MRHRVVADGHSHSRSSLLVLFCLFRPVLVVKAAVPQQNFLGVLIDDSRSMQIADWQRAAARRLRRGSSSRRRTPALLKALSSRFVIRHVPVLVDRRSGSARPPS